MNELEKPPPETRDQLRFNAVLLFLLGVGLSLYGVTAAAGIGVIAGGIALLAVSLVLFRLSAKR